MMSYYEIFAAFIMAFLFTFLFSVGFKNKGPWGILWIFFLIIFLASWAGQLWISPIGPLFYGISWLPLLFVAIIFAIILAATSSPGYNRKSVANDDSKVTKEPAVVLGVFFWLLLVILLIVIAIGYYRTPLIIKN